MTNFAAKAPTHPDRPDELHAQESLPAAPKVSRIQMATRFSILGLGVIFAVAFSAIGIQLREGWESHRDWVVPAAVSGAIISGPALAYLLLTGRMMAAAIGGALMFIALAFMLMHILYNIDGDDVSGALNSFFSIGGAVFYVGGLIAMQLALVYAIFVPKKEAAAAE